ncbi:MAG: DUF2189 domain-containing protein [Rhodospirillum sp.]|nr:DUF2189 domain-containing protein [Rhodospirillum sp.]MCF8489368.1 DUF2189 domain-containing protein [Rhodospirillum sp.]MCF8501732.1 DUF2189 domain-containing protein [Rhodospirillum sp.]
MAHIIHFMSDVIRPEVRIVSVDESSVWLRKGLDDFIREPGVSLAYGGVFTVMAFLLFLGLDIAGLASLILPLAAGFMLVAPLFAVIFYEVSRRGESGLYISLGEAVDACREKAAPLAFVGVVLLLVMLSWMILAMGIFAVFYGGAPPPVEDFLVNVLTAPQAIPFLMVGTAVGGVLATVAFALSAVSLPMIMDQDVSATTAMVTSIDTVLRNWKVMIGWGATIAFISFTGMLFLFMGLAFTMPLIGYATWHAYKALVPR